MTESYPRLRYPNDHGGLSITDALEICFYIRRSRTEMSEALVRALERFRQVAGPDRLTAYMDSVDESEDLRRLSAQAWQSIRERLLNPEPTPGYSLTLYERHGRLGEFRATCESWGLEFPNVRRPTPYRVSWLHFRLPTEYLEEHGPERVRELALELAGDLPFNSGFVNLSLFFEGSESMQQVLQQLCFRYPGLHVHDDWPCMDIGTRVNGVHWLNFLGQPVLGKLGGAAGLRARLPSPDMAMEELSGERVLIRLGERPKLGDVQADESLPLHRALARVLEPYLYHEHEHRPSGSSPLMLRWERRLLG